MNLYHKYRPKKFSKMFGNKEAVGVLEGLFKRKDFPQAILLHGPTGCGKTTAARIIKTRLEVSDHDFHEIDSSKDRSVDAVRNIINNSQYPPMESPFTIYLIDECHELPTLNQNTFLKSLEDTPKHVVYIFATTNPEKLLPAMKGRLTQITLNVLDEEEMTELLSFVLKKEKEKLSKEIIANIVESSNGHPRNALNILDNVIASPEKDREKISKQTEQEKAESIELAKALLFGKSWKKISEVLKGLKGYADPEKVRRSVIGYASAVGMNKGDAVCGLVLEEFMEPNFTNGWPQLVKSCLSVYHQK